MKENKRNDVLNKMVEINEIVAERLKPETQTIDNITYLEDFKFAKSYIGQENVYIVEISNENEIEIGDKSNNEISEDGVQRYKIYEIYDENHNLIATVEKDGKVQFSELFLQNFKEHRRLLNEEDIYFEKPEELEKNDLVMTKEDIEEHKKIKEDGKLKEEPEKTQDEEEQRKDNIAETLGIKREDIRAMSTIDVNEKITDSETLADLVPELAEFEKATITCTKPNDINDGIFAVIGEKSNGETKTIDSIESMAGISGDNKVIEINEDGSKVEQNQVKGLMLFNTGNGESGLSVSLSDYGYIDIDYVTNIHDNENRRSIPVITENEQNKRIPTEEVREQGRDSISEQEKEGKIYRRKSEKGIAPQTLDGIDIDESDGKMSLEQLKERIKDDVIEKGGIEELSSKEITDIIYSEIEQEGLTLSDEEKKAFEKEVHNEISGMQRERK